MWWCLTTFAYAHAWNPAPVDSWCWSDQHRSSDMSLWRRTRFCLGWETDIHCRQMESILKAKISHCLCAKEDSQVVKHKNHIRTQWKRTRRFWNVGLCLYLYNICLSEGICLMYSDANELSKIDQEHTSWKLNEKKIIQLIFVSLVFTVSSPLPLIYFYYY